MNGGTIFDTAPWIQYLYDRMFDCVLFLQSTFFTFPAFGDGVPLVISFYDLFFSAWAVFLIVSWIPVIGQAVTGSLDDDSEEDYILWG